ncbi:hypothetical protein OG930_37895 [Streptomyces sp. NBC_01799]|uniref:hypothetical protein n=1 Tax=Streptomyces sp. NBC_01800 TaxID=2975945 RepID=UPI002DDAF9FA|nr:hypothetical protein [Streptomyces sp. NBC_01800]WSA72364.1 hypothetical protein OIE65_38585 [Streptomyces sp. NBC_01800]WSA80878.1 hypothetical protein OG930_37895 [Streptomyces sp. NBC_01799]
MPSLPILDAEGSAHEHSHSERHAHFELTEADAWAIAALDSGTRTGPDPDSFN